MWYSSTVQEPAAGLAVSLVDAKARCIVDHGDDDDLITALIKEVTANAERYCNIRILPQTLVAKCDGFRDMARLPDGPLSDNAIQSIAYVDPTGEDQVLDAAFYELRLDGLEAAVVPATGHVWPAIQMGSRISMTVIAGFDDVPYDIQQAILLKVAERYEKRENSAYLAMSDWDALLINHRRGA